VECSVNITKEVQTTYKRHLETVEQTLLDINWVVDKRDFDRFIDKAICLREKIKEIEIELVVDKIRKKIYDGGKIEIIDLARLRLFLIKTGNRNYAHGLNPV
jgi:hypothetical protein